MKPFFSVIIPTLNEEKYLPRLLEDLKKQKEKDFEIIIIDASSTDKTKQKTEDFKPVLPIRFFTVNKKNVAYSRNFGAAKAQGEYLIFLDADCQIYSSFIKIVKKFIIKKRGLLFIPYTVPDDREPQSKIVFNIVNLLIEFSQTLNKPFSSGGSMIVEKNFFKRIGGFDEKLFIAEDHNFIQKAYQWGVRAKIFPEIKVKFSLRRMRKEGELKVFYKYLLATIHVLLTGKIKKKIFSYKMGGQEYYSVNKHFSFNGSLKDYLKQIKKFFRRYLINLPIQTRQ